MERLSDYQSALSVTDIERQQIAIISLTDIRRLANGQLSIAEFREPELMAKYLAIALIERLE